MVDLSQKIIDAWNTGNKLPIYEPGLEEVVAVGLKRGNLVFSTKINESIAEADIVFISVNTPTKTAGIGARARGQRQELRVMRANDRGSVDIGQDRRREVHRARQNVGRRPRAVLEHGAKPGVKFQVLSNPEFLAEGTAVPDLETPSRVLLGGMQTPEGLKALETVANVCANWVPREKILTTNLWSSELSKLVANAMLAQRVSSVNSISALCEATGADISRDLESLRHGSGRIGPKFLRRRPSASAARASRRTSST